MAGMTLDERFDLLMSIGEECIQTDELRQLLQDKNKPIPICYDGFEPSGRMHIAQVPRNAPSSNFESEPRIGYQHLFRRKNYVLGSVRSWTRISDLIHEIL